MRKLRNMVALGIVALAAAGATAGTQSREPLKFTGPIGRMAGNRDLPKGMVDEAAQFAKTSEAPDLLAAGGPRRLTPAGGHVYGYNSYSPSHDWLGYYEMGTPTPGMLCRDWNYYSSRIAGVKPIGAWTSDGTNIISYKLRTSSWFGPSVWTETNNLATGEQEGFTAIPVDNGYFMLFAYNPKTREIFGQGAYDGYYAWMTAPIEDPGNIELVDYLYDTEQLCIGMTYNEAEGNYYGITQFGEMLRIGADGVADIVVSDLEIPNFYPAYQGFAYSPLDDAYFFSSYSPEEGSALYSIDPKTYEVKRTFAYSAPNQYSILVSFDSLPPLTAPGKPVIDNVNIVADATSGTVTFTLPDKTYGGEGLTGELRWTLSVDEDVYNVGKAEAGEAVTVNLVSLTEGYHDLMVSCSDKELAGPTAVRSVYIGNGIPAAPANVVLEGSMLSWDAVTTGEYNGYVNPDEVEYAVLLNDVAVATTKETSIDLSEFMPKTLTRYEAVVTASYKGKTSVRTHSNSSLYGEPENVGTNYQPSESQAQLFTVSGTGDRQWGYSPSGDGIPEFSIGYDFYNELDSWLILPPTYIGSSDEVYEFRFDIGLMGYTNDQYDVCLGTSIDTEKMQVLASMEHPSSLISDPAAKKYYFTVRQPGVYYLAIHANSPANQEGMAVRNLEIRKSEVKMSSPAAVTNLRAEAAPEGGLFADVTFRLPKLSYDGKELEADRKIGAEVRGETHATVEGYPGDEVTVRVSTLQSHLDMASGVYVNNRIEVRPYIPQADAAPLRGVEKEIEVFTGIGVPAEVGDLTAQTSRDNMSVELSWTAPETGENDTYIKPADLTYVVYRQEMGLDGVRRWVAIDETDQLSYTWTVDESHPLEYAVLTVVGKSVAGEGNGFAVGAFIGRPYSLPMGVDFAKTSEDDPFGGLAPFTIIGDSEWSLADFESFASDDVEDKSGYALMGFGTASGQIGLMSLPRFSTENCTEAAIELTTYVAEEAPYVALYARTYDEELVEIAEIEMKKGLNTQAIKLPVELQGQQWVELLIATQYENINTEVFLLRSFKVVAKSSSVSVKDIEGSDLRIVAGKGEIRLLNAAGAEVNVSRLDGAGVLRGRVAGDNETLTVEKGVYVIKAGDKRKKVLVR